MSTEHTVESSDERVVIYLDKLQEAAKYLYIAAKQAVDDTFKKLEDAKADENLSEEDVQLYQHEWEMASARFYQVTAVYIVHEDIGFDDYQS